MAKSFTFEELQDEYQNLWDSMKVTRQTQVYESARKIIQYRARYEEIEKLTGVPWQFVGVLHLRESSCNFNTHLHNGDSLARRTRRVPAGRPVAAPKDGLRYTWVESAVDALKIKGLDKVENWTAPRLCYEAERYNGFGYRMSKKRPLSPYLWAGSNHYTKGKFYADGKYSASMVDAQIGVIPVLREIDKITNARSVPGSRSTWWANFGKWSGLSGLGLTGIVQTFTDFITDWKNLAIIFAVGMVATGIFWYIDRRKLNEYRQGRYIPSELTEGDSNV